VAGGSICTTTHAPPMSNNEQICGIGLDVGGTKIAAGLLAWPSGEVLRRAEIETKPGRGGWPVLNDVLSLAEHLRRDAESRGFALSGIGLGVAELVDPVGNVTSGGTVQWLGVPVKERLSRISPAEVESDVRAGALAESMFGAGRGCATFLYVTVGTGISSCLVQDGKPFAGARGNALVMGSSALSTTCNQCGARLDPVLEQFASGPAIAQRYTRAASRPVQRAQDVFQAAQDEDACAREILRSAGEALGVSVAFLVNVMDPLSVVVGGGLGLAGGSYWDAFIRSAREHIWPDETRNLPIVQAEMGADAGWVGAAAMALRKPESKRGLT
jgi:glucokinase